MKPLLVTLPGSEPLSAAIAEAIGAEQALMELRHFPDGETYLRYDSPVVGRPVVLLCTLDRPDGKLAPLLFAAAAARDLGASSVGLAAPYLAYLRQDRRFRPGEAVTSRAFARVLDGALDWLVTVDPHLHRLGALSEVYGIPAVALHAAPLLARWIAAEVERPLLVGPDAESEQWVAAVAAEAGAPHVVLQKVRHGDRAVEVSLPEVGRWHDHTPVLVDDIVSTGRTMIETIGHLRDAGLAAPVCLAVHGVFAEGAYDALRQAGAARIATSNSIAHASNAIDLTALLAEAVRHRVAQAARA
ncbi:ribose-phosphate pyrophosphokinase [Tistlia consotensis]|uniref:ribose-phosphate diphosphokinase n=1 Tax=Tistlia consotensis USBA 355 TaxID=560819 RepID=A0A1Y6BYE0_9PROT|nr:ribose-phosphate diphosphokinase [Tistlia consotensis]SMF36074.1 ribose-phosphate pyrophosphokinase [Tistlia consotensis USBA 355]SNR71376.1 ribose-phosphate pyrophosphokinase [Tistlia consotensis]